MSRRLAFPTFVLDPGSTGHILALEQEPPVQAAFPSTLSSHPFKWFPAVNCRFSVFRKVLQ